MSTRRGERRGDIRTPAPCECCGLGIDVRLVDVIARKDDTRRGLLLCVKCRTNDARAWRLAYRLADDGTAPIS